PAFENILEDSVQKVCERIEKNKQKYELEDIEIIKEGDYTTKIDKYFNEFYTKQNTFLDYISNYTIFVDEPEKIKQRILAIQKENENLIKTLIEKEKDVPEALENINQYAYNLDKTIELKEGDTLKNDFHTKEVN